MEVKLLAFSCLSVLDEGNWLVVHSGRFTYREGACYQMDERLDAPRAGLDTLPKNKSLFLSEMELRLPSLKPVLTKLCRQC